MSVVVATHGHCFDGLASAAMFTWLHRELSGGHGTRYSYRACGYGPTQRPDPGQLFSEAEGALLDYRFLPHDRLAWYFDHHRTAFSTPEDRARFEERVPNGQYHFDAEIGSCTRLVAHVARDRFGLHAPELDELVRWAHVVDTASFDSPEQAISRSDPISRLVSVVEHHGEDRFIEKYVPRLLTEPLEDIARSRDVERRYRPIGQRHDRFVEQVRAAGSTMGRVAFVDLTDAVLDTVVKFVTYALYPDCVYSVIVARLKNAAKISVGYNPWSGQDRDRDISAICARHGGGGHPVVGAIQLPSAEVDAARAIAHSIAVELAG